LSGALRAPRKKLLLLPKPAVIAESKANTSKGVLRPGFIPADIAQSPMLVIMALRVRCSALIKQFFSETASSISSKRVHVNLPLRKGLHDW
jgi:hypothetical protein